eukprot:13069435-Alexandrium_andersonii.AAC.1
MPSLHVDPYSLGSSVERSLAPAPCPLALVAMDSSSQGPCSSIECPRARRPRASRRLPARTCCARCALPSWRLQFRATLTLPSMPGVRVEAGGAAAVGARG